jgi:hypothetical protein
MIRNSVGREHSSRAMRVSASIGVRRFARIEWSWKMRSNLSNAAAQRDALHLFAQPGAGLDLSAAAATELITTVTRQPTIAELEHCMTAVYTCCGWRKNSA